MEVELEDGDENDRAEERVAAPHTDLFFGLILYVHWGNHNHATETEENWVEFLKNPSPNQKFTPHFRISNSR